MAGGGASDRIHGASLVSAATAGWDGSGASEGDSDGAVSSRYDTHRKADTMQNVLAAFRPVYFEST